MFELYQLEQLLAVAECGTLSGAAERLHLSQPALSRSMRRLEAELRVALFVRRKNKIELNENGRLAVECAGKIMEQSRDMISRIQSFDRSRRTILVGSCAPAPLWDILPALSGLYPQMTISAEIRQDGETLLQGLRNGIYQLIVLPCPVEEEGIFCAKYEEEHLYFSLPPAHPLSGSTALHLRDLDGETMLLRDRLGFWNRLTGAKMPGTRFLVQEDSAFNELVRASALPCFTTDLAIRREGLPANRVAVPILDPEANVAFYCLCRAARRSALERFFQTIHDASARFPAEPL